MTTVEVVYGYATHPTDREMLALGNAREVYGIRRLALDHAKKTIRVEYDATRLTAAVVSQLLRGAGISITDQISLLAPPLESPATEKSKDTAQTK